MLNKSAFVGKRILTLLKNARYKDKNYPNTFKMEPSMSSHGIQKNLISVSIKYSSCGVALCRTLCSIVYHVGKSY